MRNIPNALGPDPALTLYVDIPFPPLLPVPGMEWKRRGCMPGSSPSPVHVGEEWRGDTVLAPPPAPPPPLQPVELRHHGGKGSNLLLL